MPGKITPAHIYGAGSRASVVHGNSASANDGTAPYDGNIASPLEEAADSPSPLGGLDDSFENEPPIKSSDKIERGTQADVAVQRHIGDPISSPAELESVRERIEVLTRERKIEGERVEVLKESLSTSLSKCNALDEEIAANRKRLLAYTGDEKEGGALVTFVDKAGEGSCDRNSQAPESPRKEGAYKAVTEGGPEITGGWKTHTTAAFDYDADNEDDLVESSPPPSPLKESKHSVPPVSPSRKLRTVTAATVESTEDEGYAGYDENLPFMGYNDADHDNDYERSYSPPPSPRAQIKSPQVAQLKSEDEDEDDKTAKEFLKGENEEIGDVKTVELGNDCLSDYETKLYAGARTNRSVHNNYHDSIEVAQGGVHDDRNEVVNSFFMGENEGVGGSAARFAPFLDEEQSDCDESFGPRRQLTDDSDFIF